MSQIIKNLASGPIPPSVPTSFFTDSGTAVPALNILNVLGGVGVNTSGLGNTITIVTDSLLPYTAVTGPTTYVVLATDTFISCDTTAGIITIQLPNSTSTGREIVVKDRTGTVSTNSIVITTVGGLVTIDGMSSYTFTDNYESVDLMFGSSVYQTF